MQYFVPSPLKRLTDLLAEYVDGGKHHPAEILLAAVAGMIPHIHQDLTPGVKALMTELVREMDSELAAKAAEESSLGGYVAKVRVALEDVR